MAGTIFFGEGPEIGFGAAIVVLGFALGGVIFLAPALVAEVVDEVCLRQARNEPRPITRSWAWARNWLLRSGC